MTKNGELVSVLRRKPMIPASGVGIYRGAVELAVELYKGVCHRLFYMGNRSTYIAVSGR